MEGKETRGEERRGDEELGGEEIRPKETTEVEREGKGGDERRCVGRRFGDARGVKIKTDERGGDKRTREKIGGEQHSL